MANVFDSVLVKRPESSRFDLSHSVKSTVNMGVLAPMLTQEILPGDTWKAASQVFLRAMPLVSPVMHEVDVYMHHFYVPYRCVWNDWDDFLRGGDDNMTEIPKPVLRISALDWETFFEEGCLADYFGIPPSLPNYDDTEVDINALPFMAYQQIYENYFADQNLEPLYFEKIKRYVLNNPVIRPDDTIEIDGVRVDVFRYLIQIRNRCWAHDYFTSSMPNTQRGADVHLPLYGSAPLRDSGKAVKFATANENMEIEFLARDGFGDTISAYKTTGTQDITADTDFTHVPNLKFKAETLGYVDLSAALGATINDFREAMQLQKYNELIQRVGNRIKEWYKGVWDVNVPDMRLNLPEYLGGGKGPVMVSEVLQQSETTSDSPQGNMAGRAVSAGAYGFGRKYFPEYGVIISIMSIIPKPAYSQGLHKMWFKSDRFDFGQPIFANLGEQPVYNKELYFDPSDGKDDDVFGYLPRYSEYKFIPSQVSGAMRSTLEFWHLGRVFQSRPVLNRDFVHTDKDDFTRIFAVEQSADYYQFVVQIHHYIRARRKLPYYSVPL